MSDEREADIKTLTIDYLQAEIREVAVDVLTDYSPEDPPSDADIAYAQRQADAIANRWAMHRDATFADETPRVPASSEPRPENPMSDEDAIRSDERERLSARVYELGWCPTCARNLDAAELAAAIMVDPAEVLSPEELAEYERCQHSVIDARRRAPMVEGEIVIGARVPASSEPRPENPRVEVLSDALRDIAAGRHGYQRPANQIAREALEAYETDAPQPRRLPHHRVERSTSSHPYITADEHWAMRQAITRVLSAWHSTACNGGNTDAEALRITVEELAPYRIVSPEPERNPQEGLTGSPPAHPHGQDEASKSSPLDELDYDALDTSYAAWVTSVAVLRHAMMCRAGREYVEKNLLTPYRYIEVQDYGTLLDRLWDYDRGHSSTPEPGSAGAKPPSSNPPFSLSPHGRDEAVNRMTAAEIANTYRDASSALYDTFVCDLAYDSLLAAFDAVVAERDEARAEVAAFRQFTADQIERAGSMSELQEDQIEAQIRDAGRDRIELDKRARRLAHLERALKHLREFVQDGEVRRIIDAALGREDWE